jgi:hypothetical protein
MSVAMKDSFHECHYYGGFLDGPEADCPGCGMIPDTKLHPRLRWSLGRDIYHRAPGFALKQPLFFDKRAHLRKSW